MGFWPLRMVGRYSWNGEGFGGSMFDPTKLHYTYIFSCFVSRVLVFLKDHYMECSFKLRFHIFGQQLDKMYLDVIMRWLWHGKWSSVLPVDLRDLMNYYSISTWTLKKLDVECATCINGISLAYLLWMTSHLRLWMVAAVIVFISPIIALHEYTSGRVCGCQLHFFPSLQVFDCLAPWTIPLFFLEVTYVIFGTSLSCCCCRCPLLFVPSFPGSSQFHHAPGLLKMTFRESLTKRFAGTYLAAPKYAEGNPFYRHGSGGNDGSNLPG